MIAKGNTHDNGARLARYIVTGKEGEFAELWELRGFASRDITDAFRSVHITAGKSQCTQPFFHVQIRNPEGETLTRAQWKMAVDKIEGMLGLADQPRAIAVHTDRTTDHEHVHVAWSRIDPDTLKAKALPFFKLRLKKVCRELESALGLTPVPSDRKSSIRFAPKRHEEQQAIRLGVAVNDVREVIKAAFERSDCGRSFQAALANEGLTLARGDRRDFVAVDRAGGMHALGKRILGASTADIRARLSNLSRNQLPTVEQARQLLRNPVKLNTSVIEIPTPQHGARQREQGAAQFINYVPEVRVSLPEDASDLVWQLEPDLQPAPANRATVRDSLKAADTTQHKVKSHGFATTLKRQFSAAAKALFKESSSPRPHVRRRRTGDTVGTFRLVARNILRPIIRMPPISRAIDFLNDALPWLHLWEWNEGTQDFSEESPNGHDNHHSPHP